MAPSMFPNAFFGPFFSSDASQRAAVQAAGAPTRDRDFHPTAADDGHVSQRSIMMKEKHTSCPQPLDTVIVSCTSIDPTEYTYWSEADLDDARHSGHGPRQGISLHTAQKPCRKFEKPSSRKPGTSSSEDANRVSRPVGHRGYLSKFNHMSLVSLVRLANIQPTRIGTSLQQLSHQDLVELLEKSFPKRTASAHDRTKDSLASRFGKIADTIKDALHQEAPKLAKPLRNRNGTFAKSVRKPNGKFARRQQGRDVTRAPDNVGPGAGLMSIETARQCTTPGNERRAKPTYTIKTQTYGSPSATFVGPKSLMEYLKNIFPRCVDLENNALVVKLATQPMARMPKLRRTFSIAEHAETVSTSLMVIAIAIQASGQTARKPCTCCRRGNGPFQDCVVIPFNLFPTQEERRHHWHCANCHVVPAAHCGKAKCSIKKWSSMQSSWSVVLKTKKEEGVKHASRDVIEISDDDDTSPGLEACSVVSLDTATAMNVDGAETRELDVKRDFTHNSINAKHWEVAPGYIRATSNGERVAFSKDLMSGPQPVRMANNFASRVQTVPAYDRLHLEVDRDDTTICFLVSGTLSVQMAGEAEFAIGPLGAVKVGRGVECVFWNRTSTEAVLHICSVNDE